MSSLLLHELFVKNGTTLSWVKNKLTMKRTYMTLWIIIPIFSVILLLSLYWVYRAHSQAKTWVYPVRHIAEETPAKVGLVRWETVSFVTDDGLRLKGWFIPATSPVNGNTVILVHGLSSNRSAMLDRAVFLAAHGYQALLFDLRNHGTSEGVVTTVGYLEGQDVLAAAAYLRSRSDVDPTRIVVWGHSLGAVAVMKAAAADPLLRAVIAESGFPNLEPEVTTPIIHALTGRNPTPSTAWVLWFVERETGVPVDQLDLYAALEEIASRPILFVHGMDDIVVPMESSEKMFAAASEPKELFLIPGAGHSNLLEPNPTGYEERLLKFLNAALP